MNKNTKILLTVAVLIAVVIAAQNMMRPFAVVYEDYVPVSSVTSCGKWSHEYAGVAPGRYSYYYNYYWDGEYQDQVCYSGGLGGVSQTYTNNYSDESGNYHLKVTAYWHTVGSWGGFRYYCAVEYPPATVTLEEPQIDSMGRASILANIDPGYGLTINRSQTKILCYNGIVWGELDGLLDPTLEKQDVMIRWDVERGLTGLCKVNLVNDKGHSTGWVTSEDIAYTDLCAGVSCPDYCVGTTLYRDGRCIDGDCVYTTLSNAPQCVHVTPLPDDTATENGLWIIGGVAAFVLLMLYVVFRKKLSKGGVT